MFYPKPHDVTYTQMAIFIDENIYEDESPRVQETCFEYMWHLFYINAVKNRLFSRSVDYDEYSLYCASYLYMLYKRKEEEGMPRILSCLNYIKKIYYGMKVDFCKETFREIYREGITQDDVDNLTKEEKSILEAKIKGEAKVNSVVRENKLSEIRRVNSSIMREEYTIYLEELPKTIKGCLKDSFYSKDRMMIHNIYLSCLLTFLKLTTLSNENKERIKKRHEKAWQTADIIDKLYEEEYQDSIVLYHLPKTMTNYIDYMVNVIKKEIVKDLRYIIGSNEMPDSVMKDLLLSSDDTTYTNYEET